MRLYTFSATYRSQWDVSRPDILPSFQRNSNLAHTCASMPRMFYRDTECYPAQSCWLKLELDQLEAFCITGLYITPNTKHLVHPFDSIWDASERSERLAVTTCTVQFSVNSPVVANVWEKVYLNHSSVYIRKYTHHSRKKRRSHSSP